MTGKQEGKEGPGVHQGLTRELSVFDWPLNLTFYLNCLWRGSNINGRGAPKAAWEMVCKTKEEGGRGVINLQLQNQALLMKNLDKFFNKKDIPWVHLI
jgi:hypothetical protein